MYKYLLYFIGIGIVFLIINPENKAHAEPWISNRYSQNCAACHAPGRLNLEAKGRRCTLSCQGCHVNPNGSGLRNRYGQWVQERWLKSAFRPKFMGKAKKIPAVFEKQKYYRKTHAKKKKKLRKKRRRRRIPRMRTVKGLGVDESRYDNKNYTLWKEEAKSKYDFLSTIPKGDPYREERKMRVQAGGDFRYLYGSNTSETTQGTTTTETETDLNFLMAVDFGVRLRPTPEKLSIVIESRFLNGPTNTDLENGFTTFSQVRSAYFLVDDIWYNSHLMGGIYKPMFGHENPDHLALSNSLKYGIGASQSLYFKAFGLGASPNVPFFNIHSISHMTDETKNRDDGLVVNLGLRMVTLGLSAKFSYWDTTDIDTEDNREMMAITAGSKLGNAVVNFETVRVSTTDNSTTPASIDEGNVHTLDFNYRLWREIYFTSSYSVSNVAKDLTQGSASEIKLGARFYLISGVKIHLEYVTGEETQKVDRNTLTNEVSTDSNRTYAQLHFYF